MSGYIGISNTSKKINKLYIGVNGVSKSVSKAYIGIGNVSKLWYQGIDPTKNPLTEEEFIAICQAGLQDQIPIGNLITLANSYQNTWEVIGVNHDGTSSTVDIMSHTNIHETKFGSSQYYSGSTLQTFCNETIPNAFTNATTKSLIKTMDVVSNGSTLTGQKGKALSMTEIGSSSSSAEIEGNSYGLSNYLFRSGVDSYVWTRSRYTSASKNLWVVHSAGVYHNHTWALTSDATLPVLRF